MPPAEQQVPATPRGPRYALVDLVRGLAIVAMVAYHFAWDLYYLGFTSTDVMTEPGWVALQRSILSSFLLLVGAGLVLGHGGGIRWAAFWRRFLVLVAAAVLVTAGTYFAFPDYFVFFGVLHAIALFSLCALPLLRAPLWLMAAVAALFLVLPGFVVVPEFTDKRLAWIGFWPVSPMTTDIVPFFPWFGMVALGLLGMRLLLGSAWRPLLAAWRPGRWSGWLAVAGRWSLVIYLVHQPLLYGGLTLLSQLQPPALMPAVRTTEQIFVESCEASCGANGGEAPYCQRYCSCAVDIVDRDNLWELVNSGVATPERQAALDDIQRLCAAMAE